VNSLNTQKNTVIRQAGILLIILLVLSVSYSVIIYMVSSSPLPPWQGSEIHPDMESDISSHSIASSNLSENRGDGYRHCNNPMEVHDDHTIIGPFHMDNYSIVLTDLGNEVFESVSGNGNSWQYLLKPEHVNTTLYDEKSLGIADTTAGTSLYRLPLKFPENTSLYSVKDIVIYDAWIERSWDMGTGRNLVHTGGRFYGIYGQEIIQVADRSYSVSSQLFDQGDACRAETGYGEATGWVSTDTTWTLRNFPLKVKYSTVSWITVDNDYSTRFGISMDKWFSTSLDRGAGR